MAEPLISEEELTELLRLKIAQGVRHNDNDSMLCMAKQQARALARRMLAADAMYEALTRLADTYDSQIARNALKRADEGGR